ncbi:GHKL domain-containing protein [Pseudobutyrivibrio xylanivorans]|uniref:Sensor histidine kinase n=1 Tax=Pseudobutyrivibrio xylanivorans TaxID=185007 RepID=A0A5P6VUP2_PSEXY|nr:GHKL domain-containing protein [Pseudobutyrivibrio xylanivorans]QFJ56373.1 sensor histidine kinase [Pseudobutyrivibrio xylanivorans]
MNIHLTIIMLLNAIELAVPCTILARSLERRNYFVLRLFCCLALVFVYIFLFPLDGLNYLLIHIPIILVAFLYLKLCYKTTMTQTVFLGTIGYTLKHISSLINSIITVFFPRVFGHFSETKGEYFILGYALIIGIDIIVFSIAYYITAKKAIRAELQKNATIPMSILGAIVLIMNQFWSLGIVVAGADYTVSYSSLIEYIWNLMFCFLVLAIQFNIVQISEKDKELEITQRLIADKEQQYKMSKSNMEAIQKKCHDLKYEIAAIAMGVEPTKHAEDAMAVLRTFNSDIKTGNTTLDIIFNEKNYYCKDHDIVFTPMIDGAALSFIKTTDLYVLFSGLIDSAISSVRQLANHTKRYIYIYVHSEKGFLLIQIEHPLDLDKDYILKERNGQIIVKRPELAGLEYVIEKYDGSINTKLEEDVFMLNIIFPISESLEQEKK